MKITGVDTFPVVVPLTTPIVMSNHVVGRSRNVLVKVSTDEGLVGWGEGVEAPTVTGETQERIEAAARHLGDLIIGTDPLRHTTLWHRMRRANPDSTTAVAALDIALHDLAGRALGVPVSEIVGGRVRDRVPALKLIGSGDPRDDLAKLESARRDGFRWFKLKLALTDPAREVETLRKAAAEIGTEDMVCGDANEGWDEPTAQRVLGRLDGSGVRFIEQPISRGLPRTLARLAHRSPIPLCADESAGWLTDLADMASMGMGGVSLKLIKHGGITGVMRGAVMCADLGLSINLAGKVAETSIAAAANLQCAAAIASIDYGCSPANQGLAADVTDDPPRVVDGFFSVPDGPGLGIEVDEGLVAAMVGTG